MTEERQMNQASRDEQYLRDVARLREAVEAAALCAALGDSAGALKHAKQALRSVGSHECAAVLVLLPWQDLPTATLRRLLVEWTGCEGAGPHFEVLRAMFERAAPVCDSRAGIPATPCTIYRAHFAEQRPHLGTSWTMSRATAEWFADYLVGPRARFAGIRGSGGIVITEATCARVLGYFNDRDEQEGIPDLATITVVRQWVPDPVRDEQPADAAQAEGVEA